jgi:hypothetical protein
MDNTDFNRLDGITKKYVDYKISGLTFSGGGGSSGTSGTSGGGGTASGTSGSSGTSGTRGSSGSSGTSGANGSSGSSGTSGANGSSGSSGTSGNSGSSGSSGTSGANGSSGSSGTSGSNGSSGTSLSLTVPDSYFLRPLSPGLTGFSDLYHYPTYKASNAHRVGIESLAGNNGGLYIELVPGVTGSWNPLLFNGNAGGSMSIVWEFDSINSPAAPTLVARKISNAVASLDFYTPFNDVSIRTLELRGQQTSHNDGLSATPSITFFADTNTGLFRPGTDQLGISTGGVTSSVFNSSGMRIPGITSSFLATDSTGQIIATSSFGTIGITIDGAGSAITTGLKNYITIPFNCQILEWTILSDVSGSIVIDVWKDTFANFPPTVADSIAGTEKPTLSSQDKNQDNTLTTWTTSINQGDILAFYVDSASTLTKVNLALKISR